MTHPLPSRLLLAAGLALSLAGMRLHPARFGRAWLVAVLLFWSLSLGAMFFVALQHVTGALWSVVVRRAGEIFASFLPWAATGFLLLGICPFFSATLPIFPWHGTPGEESTLDEALFLVRAMAYFLLWCVSARWFVRSSLRQDAGDGEGEIALRLKKWSGPFLVFFGLSVTAASFDWLMRLVPGWYSTIFGVYVFSGLALTGIAGVTLLALAAGPAGRLPVGIVTEEHRYSLGLLLFAFVCFWGYIGFSQFLLIWYGNLPEETVWLARRMEGGWGMASLGLILVRFVLPFLLLLPARAKRSAGCLQAASLVAILGQALDLYWLVMPEAAAGARPSWVDAGPLFLAGGLALLLTRRFLSRHPLLPLGDPRLASSIRYRI